MGQRPTKTRGGRVECGDRKSQIMNQREEEARKTRGMDEQKEAKIFYA